MRFEDFEPCRIKLEEVEILVRTGGSGPPLILLHGWPQHGLMWHTIAPSLATKFTVIVPDQRGAGASGIPMSGYDKTTLARDVAGMLNALGHERAFVAGYDLGAAVAAAFARDHPARTVRLAVMEVGLAGFGYEQTMAPAPDWHIGSNWHLALFTVPQAAEWLLRGRERELLAWFFHHISYAGQSAVSPAHFEAYVREIAKPGALRAGIEYYASVWADASDNAILRSQPLAMPVLATGGEASAGQAMEMLWKPLTRDLRCVVIPRAGHWLGDENPGAVSEALAMFFGEKAPAG